MIGRPQQNFYHCRICNAPFILERTMLRHFYGELEGFREFAREKRETYELQRLAWRQDHPVIEVTRSWSEG